MLVEEEEEEEEEGTIALDLGSNGTFARREPRPIAFAELRPPSLRCLSTTTKTTIISHY
jgi:hypothetical protein